MKHWWVRMPSTWIKKGGLTVFSPRNQGEAVTALKLYLAILSAAGGKRLPDSDRSCTALSYTDLESQSDVSRGMIPRGLGLLEPLIRVEPGTGRATNLYVIRDYPAKGAGGWAKLPSGYIQQDNKLRGFSPRSRTDLSALKLYLLLLAFRENVSNEARISYDKIREYSNLHRNDISRACSKLLDSKLVMIGRGGDNAHGAGRPSPFSRYAIVGL